MCSVLTYVTLIVASKLQNTNYNIIFVGGITRKVELQHFTEDAEYLSLVRK